jgi:hypothetical protein
MSEKSRSYVIVYQKCFTNHFHSFQFGYKLTNNKKQDDFGGGTVTLRKDGESHLSPSSLHWEAVEHLAWCFGL